MYIINIPESSIVNPEEFRMVSETVYHAHPSVAKVQLWVKSERDANGNLTRNNIFSIVYKDGEEKRVLWKNYDPKFYRAATCVSHDGDLLFLPDYEKGIQILEIGTCSVKMRVQTKHIFSVWVTESSLLCLHKESNREIVRIDYHSGEIQEKVRAAGLGITPLTEHCILYKKNEETYVIADPDNLQDSTEMPVTEWLGFPDSNFNIKSAVLVSGKIDAECFYTDKNDSKKIITGKMRLSLPEKWRSL